MGLEFAANIGILIAVVGFMLFFLRRMDRMKDELKAEINQLRGDTVRMETGLKGDMVRMEAGLKGDMVRMEAGIRADMAKMETGLKAEIAKVETGLKAEIAKVETGLKAEIAKVETGLKEDINLKHGEVRQDLQDVRHGLMEVRERQARLEGILEGRGVIPAPEPAATAE